MKVAIYTRVSTDEQAREGYSLEVQEEYLRDFAKRQGWEIYLSENGKIYSDDITGYTLDRPALKKLFSDAKQKKFDLVIVYKIDRFSRKLMNLLNLVEELESYGIGFKSATEPFDTTTSAGKLMFQQLGSFAEFERNRIAERVFPGMIKGVERGNWQGARYAPYGYHYNKEKKLLEIIPEEAQIIKLIYTMYLSGQSTGRIAGYLYQKGYKTRSGGKFQTKLIGDILKNKFYLGKYPLLADMETYTKVQRILDLHNHGANRRRKYRFLLSGLLFCNECGSRLIGEKHAKKSGLIFDYYRCMGPRHNEENCSQAFLPTQDIEEEVADLFKNVSLSNTLLKGLRFALEEVYAAQNQKDNQWVKTLENRRDGILKKMNRLEELLLEGVIAKERVIEKYQPLKDELDVVGSQIEQNKTSGRKLKREDIDKILGFFKALDNTYVHLPETKKKLFLRLLISKILVKDKKISKIIYTPVFQGIADKNLVRITNEWRRGRDSNSR